MRCVCRQVVDAQGEKINVVCFGASQLVSDSEVHAATALLPPLAAAGAPTRASQGGGVLGIPICLSGRTRPDVSHLLHLYLILYLFLPRGFF